MSPRNRQIAMMFGLFLFGIVGCAVIHATW